MSSQSCYPEKAPAINTLLDTLGHHIRREIIYYFENYSEDETATFDELAGHICDRVPDQTTSRLRIKLVHNHLPKLADRGWLDYDTRTEQIRYRGHDSAERFLGELVAIF